MEGKNAYLHICTYKNIFPTIRLLAQRLWLKLDVNFPASLHRQSANNHVLKGDSVWKKLQWVKKKMYILK